jgi:phosphatidylinositol phospholipase C, delta
MAAVTSAFSKLNPFGSKAKATKEADDDDIGEQVDETSLAGGGHAGRQTRLTKTELRVPHALRSFLVAQHALDEVDAGLENPEQLTPAVKSLLDRPHIVVPPELTNRSHPLPHYFISSSHNTYLLAHQLYGSSSATAYESALKAGARCVEIDAWDDDNKDEPKVTHGYTLTSHISFRKVCETIRDVVDQEAREEVNVQGYRAAPILLSLENHCDAYGQQRLAAIMREVFGDRLLTKPIRDKGTREQEGTGEHVTLQDLGSKICVIVEYHFAGEPDSDDDSSSSDSEDEEAKKARLDYKDKKKQVVPTVIVPELAELGVYAQSVKPPNNAWYERGVLENSPHHPLINVSESGLASHMPDHNHKIAQHNAEHLMRVYPKGTRISSRNLKPVPFFGVGAQICAMNWQTFGASMQLNEALFSGTDGYVLKPPHLLPDGNGKSESFKRTKLRVHVGGAADVPAPEDKASDMKPYLTCTLVHPDDLEGKPPKRKTSAYKQHKLGFLHSGENPPVTDPVWDEILEWEYQENELVFLRMLIKSDDSFARNPIYAVGAVRLRYVQPGWSFIRMLDLKGHETRCVILAKFEFIEVDGRH